MSDLRVCPQCSSKTLDAVCPHDGRPTIEAAKLEPRRRRDPLVGSTIDDKYVVEERLGKGSFGAVYKARHVTTGGPVALKLLSAESLEDANAVKRFYIEAQNTHALQHPNTVRVSDFGQTDNGVLFLVMQFVDGRTLRQLQKDEGRLAPARVVHITEQILKSLGEAHGQGVVHRDIKPANIMLLDQFGEPDFVKVLDFGISRSLEGTGAQTQGAIGTPKYMAPEQWRNSNVDGRSDLYAVGCMMYEMLSGRPPFEAQGTGTEKMIGLMRGHLDRVAFPLLEAVPDLCPPPLARFVWSMMEKDPSARPSTAYQALERLGAIGSNDVLATTPSTLPWPVALADAEEMAELGKTAAVNHLQLVPTAVHEPVAPAGPAEHPGDAEDVGPSTQIPVDIADTRDGWSGAGTTGLKGRGPASPVVVGAALAASVFLVAGGWMAFSGSGAGGADAPPSTVSTRSLAAARAADPTGAPGASSSAPASSVGEAGLASRSGPPRVRVTSTPAHAVVTWATDPVAVLGETPLEWEVPASALEGEAAIELEVRLGTRTQHVAIRPAALEDHEHIVDLVFEEPDPPGAPAPTKSAESSADPLPSAPPEGRSPTGGEAAGAPVPPNKGVPASPSASSKKPAATHSTSTKVPARGPAVDKLGDKKPQKPAPPVVETHGDKGSGSRPASSPPPSTATSPQKTGPSKERKKIKTAAPQEGEKDWW